MKRHIVQVSAYYPPHLGGQEYAAQNLAEALGAKKYIVDVIASAIGGKQGTQTESNVTVTRLPGRAFGHAPIMPDLPHTLFATASRRSVVHLHVGQAFTPEIVWAVSRVRKFPYIAQLHIDFEPSGPMGFLLPFYKKHILQPVIKHAAAVIVLNQNALNMVKEKYGRTKNVHIIHNGIDEPYFALRRPAFATHPPTTLQLLFVGRLTRQKNIEALLHAIAKTKRPVQLDIIGEGEERANIEHLVQKLELKNVTLHGRLPREDIRSFYESRDALIMPSLYEAQPLVLLEALAARIPIIGTDVVGVAEHVQGAGIIVEPTPEGLAKGIARYDTIYPQLPRMTARGFARAERHRWQNLLPQYEALYEKISKN